MPKVGPGSSRKQGKTVTDSPVSGRGECGFPRARRLLTARDFRWVFDSRPKRLADRYFTLLVAARHDAGPGQVARLGLAISKKQARRAVDRNRFKRLVREAFRQRADLPAVDIVVMVRAAACPASNDTLASCLNRLLDSLPGHDSSPRRRQHGARSRQPGYTAGPQTPPKPSA